MTEPNAGKGDISEEILNRKNLGEKKYHSETSLQKFGEENEEPEATKDPGVLNTSVTALSLEDALARRRAVSQPGPAGGSLVTATAGRTRRRPPRNVMYAADLERTDSTEGPKLILSNRDDYSFPPTPLGNPLSYNGNGNLYGNFRNGDIKSLNSYRMNTPTELRGGTTPRKRSVATMDAQSLRSVETHAPPPTSPEENSRLTIKYLSLMLSCMYAVLLVTLGFIVYITDPFLRHMAPSPIYSLVLLGIGFLYHVYLIIDIARYKRVAVKNQKIKGLHNKNLQEFFRKQEEEFGYSPGEGTPGSTASQSFPSAALLPMNHDYCFSHGRHSGSFYLKLGAAGFALGHLIHSVLQITVQVGFLVDDDIDNDECIDYPQFAYDIANPLYCFVQLYFIFKYSNVHILKAQGLAHFGFMHMIGSSLCFWVYNIVRETVLALSIYAGILYGNRTIEEEPHEELPPNLDISVLHNENCTGSQAITSIIENFSPYLYPFGVEYNILIVAIYYIIWSHIGICDNEDSDSSSGSGDNQTVCKIPTASEENDYTSNIVVHADCHASNKGLFLGLVLTVCVAGLLILGFVFSSVGNEYLELGYFINSCTKLGLHIMLLFGVVIAFNQTRKLDINEHPVSLLDDILLFICLPAFFMETVFSMIATINILNVIKSIDVMVMAVQIIIQTTLLVDGLRRCSNSRKLRRSKPGREVLMFLLIANVAMWLIHTFSYKAPDSLDERYEFYGKVLWSILGHVCLPLIMFYRFHSSVCFADIWGGAYKPGSDH
ncbi:proton channel OtopLc-like [Bicyclus anynana]|uniref:Proton channel OtopLc-like n=1 Tax=Bicyclus anynana TaxID=110368 RepID=A0ABM3LGI2_BICAN|nr:proton channel OtopLc-like [Bicyclus anynana]